MDACVDSQLRRRDRKAIIGAGHAWHSWEKSEQWLGEQAETSGVGELEFGLLPWPFLRETLVFVAF